MIIKDAVVRRAELVDGFGESIQTANVSSFGDQVSSPNRAFSQAVPSYNFVPANFREFTSTGGSTGTEDRKFKVSTGTSVGGCGAIQSFRSLKFAVLAKRAHGSAADVTAALTYYEDV